MAASSAAPSDTSVADRMRVEIDRAIRRNLKGFGYLGSPDPAVGQTPKTLLHRRGTLSRAIAWTELGSAQPGVPVNVRVRGVVWSPPREGSGTL